MNTLTYYERSADIDRQQQNISAVKYSYNSSIASDTWLQQSSLGLNCLISSQTRSILKAGRYLECSLRR